MKKFLALILSLLCVFALAFTACGKNQNNNSDDTDNTTDNNQDGTNDDNTNDNTDDENNNTTTEHTCIYNLGSWASNSQTHWHASLCAEHPDNKKDEAPHIFVDGKCTTCKRVEIYGVGDKFPAFEIETFQSSYTEGKFSSEDYSGKVIVLNFWYTNCDPCVAEMPEIENVKNAYGDQVEILALHATSKNYQGYLADAPAFVNRKGWSGYNIIFGKDNDNDYLYNKVIGATGHPVTVVINGEGIITAIVNGTLFPYIGWTLDKEDTLSPLIEQALGN